MGQSTGKVLKKVASPVSNAASYFFGTNQEEQTSTAVDLSSYRLPSGSIFVMKRTGSMYFDEDGDLAHEFYEEQYSSHRHKMIMKRKRRNLKPQGEVDLPIPRLHNNLPFVLCEAPIR